VLRGFRLGIVATWTAGLALTAGMVPGVTMVPHIAGVPGTANRPAPETVDSPGPGAVSPPTSSPKVTLVEAAGSVTYLRRRYGISEAEALRRLTLQRAAPGLAQRLTADFPDDYAGMWMDHARGGLLTVGMTRPERLPSALRDVTDAAHVRAVSSARSLRQLNATAQQVAAQLNLVVGEDVVVDQPGNAVIVFTGGRLAAADPRVPGLSAMPGVRTRSRPVSPQYKACDPLQCGTPPMVAGIRLDVTRDDGTLGGCTTGFNIRSAVTGEVYVLTAGHCVNAPNHTKVDQTWHAYPSLGIPVSVEDTAMTENAYPLDYAVMPYRPGAAAFWLPWIRDRVLDPTPWGLVNYWCPGGCSGSYKVRIAGVADYATIGVGWVVCATGSGYTPAPGEQHVDSGAGRGYVPGTRCGEVTALDGGIVTNICARRGDSGGPLFTEADRKALGILSHGDPGSGACTNPAERNHYAPVSKIVQRINARTGNAKQLRVITASQIAPVPGRPHF
jgi:streptogrisin C